MMRPSLPQTSSDTAFSAGCAVRSERFPLGKAYGFPAETFHQAEAVPRLSLFRSCVAGFLCKITL